MRRCHDRRPRFPEYTGRSSDVASAAFLEELSQPDVSRRQMRSAKLLELAATILPLGQTDLSQGVSNENVSHTRGKP
jgi:hypothetical protein